VILPLAITVAEDTAESPRYHDAIDCKGRVEWSFTTNPGDAESLDDWQRVDANGVDRHAGLAFERPIVILSEPSLKQRLASGSYRSNTSI